MSEIKSMEHSTLKVPYEILNKKFRTAQKVLDREFDQIQSAAKDVKVAMNVVHTQTSVAEVNKLVGCVVKKIQVLKRKASDSINEESQASNVCKKKLDHLKAVIPQHNVSSEMWFASLDQWKRTRMDRIIIEHMLRMGYYATAERLANKCEIRELSNFDIFQISREIEEDLANHSTAKCILWCLDNKSKLRKINSNIEFNLRVQEFVEFVRSNRRVDAVMHSRKYFPAYEKTQLKEICKCMALLALQPDTNVEPYKSLFDIRRWDELIVTFRNENFRLFQLSTHSLLAVAVQAGLSALKTPQCYIPTCRNLNCPVCQEDLNRIAKKLPFSHCVQSRLICRITGLPLNEHNLPMMLPNGQIFGQLAIPEITKENGTVVCPITNTKFLNPKIEKVFIM